ncbi:uncharacterized protein LOC110441170 [Mizuhopecten yessoensis]|uniref:uncharacterized protein LOC110441170 n=1 Tax=Mizuhopecten yessoensis TaxID=6573 RepID=UPI000B45A094|nr:uncharacterized protein LOC110441170 [Mizuhopecten yessoensis]
MLPKSKKASSRGRGSSMGKRAASSPNQEVVTIIAEVHTTPVESEDDSQRLSPASSKDRGKRNKSDRIDCSFSESDEAIMVEWLQENGTLWDSKLQDYHKITNKGKLWATQEEKMHKTVKHLKGWFRSLRDKNTRLIKHKSGEDAPRRTEREEWVLSNLRFLQEVVRHRPEPAKPIIPSTASSAATVQGEDLPVDG